jgi:Rieske 2Fe-2S family protein
MTKYLKTTSTHIDGSKTLQAKYYLSEKIFQKEKKNIFEEFWFCLGHVGRIPNRGDYFLQEAFGENFLVVRGEGKKVHVHFNVCAHRGTMVCKPKAEVDGKANNRKTIQCQYHGWTYNLDGKLIAAPSMEEVKGFNKTDISLLSPPVYIWEGFIFISFRQKPKPFEEVYAPMLDRLSEWGVAGLERRHSEKYQLKANWKLIFLNFSECYHCSIAHKVLSRYISDKSAQNDLSSGPFLGGLMDILNDGESVTSNGNLCALPLGGKLTTKTAKKGYYYSILGNLLLNIHPDYLMFHCLFPQSASETRVESDWLFDPLSGTSLEEREKQRDPVNIWSETNKEDWELCELQQQGLGSKAYRSGYYSNRESLLAAFDFEYLRLMK